MYADTTKVRITDCHDKSLWYQNRVGEIFEVSYWTNREVYVKTHDSYNTGNFIQIDNVELVK